MIIETLDPSQLLRVTGGAIEPFRGADRGGLGSLVVEAGHMCDSGRVPQEVQDAMSDGMKISKHKLIGGLGHPEVYNCAEKYKNWLLRNDPLDDWKLPGNPRQ